MHVRLFGDFRRKLGLLSVQVTKSCSAPSVLEQRVACFLDSLALA